MKPTRRRLALVLGHSSLVISSAAFLAADDASLRPIAFQNGVNQQSLGAETAELAKAITDLIDELQRNGFPIQSLNGLTELAAQLNTLGGTEMTAIASRLRKLGENAQADPRATATEAYLAQQAIETRLKTLARQISIQQLREETARRLESLITRQVASQRETRAIATATPDAERQRILESDQTGIGEDLVTFFQTGENLLGRLRESNTPTPAGAPVADQSFAARINAPYLTTLSTEAVGHLKDKRYPDAYGRQEALIVELRKILQGILSSLPKEQRLASALQQVSALLQQQQANQQNPANTTPESNQQAADQAQKLANQVAPLSPEAAAALKQAEKLLQNPPPKPPVTPPANQASTPPTPGSKPTKTPSPANPAATPSQDPEVPITPSGTKPPPDESDATAALAAAQAALQNALAQAQQQNSPNAQNPSQQQAGNQQSPNGQPPTGPQPPGQQPPGQQQAGTQPGQPQPQNQNGQQQSPQNQPQTGTQLTANGQPPNPNQTNSQGTYGDAQNQIAGHGANNNDPAQVIGALRRDEREAFTALQGERYPAEYSAWVQQYWRNLAQE